MTQLQQSDHEDQEGGGEGHQGQQQQASPPSASAVHQQQQPKARTPFSSGDSSTRGRQQPQPQEPQLQPSARSIWDEERSFQQSRAPQQEQSHHQVSFPVNDKWGQRTEIMS